jgi:hypothetical protein
LGALCGVALLYLAKKSGRLAGTFQKKSLPRRKKMTNRNSGCKPVAHAAALLFFAVFTFTTTPAGAAGATDPAFTMNVTPLYQFDGNLDSGGEVSVFRVLVNAGSTLRLSENVSLRLNGGYSHADFDFSGNSTFMGGTPWDKLHTMDFSAGFSCTALPGWRFTATPSVRIAREEGAGWGNAFQYGGSLSASREFGDTLTLGLGAAVFSQLEEVTVTPLLLVNWRISERLTLANPLRSGLAGPAGLELTYRLDNGWDLATGAAYRSERFRLKSSGSYADGIGEFSSIPVWARLSRRMGSTFSLDLSGGVAFGGKVRVEDRHGRRLASDDFDPAPFMAVTIAARF